MDDNIKLMQAINHLRGNRVITYTELENIATKHGVNYDSQAFSNLLELIDNSYLNSDIVIQDNVMDGQLIDDTYLSIDDIYNNRATYLTVRGLKELATQLY